MKLSKNCGLSFGAVTCVQLFLEIIFSGAIAAFCSISWINFGSPSKYLYESGLKDDYIVRNRNLEECVILWCLTIVMAICIWRVVSSVILFVCVRRNSAILGQYWMAYKVLALMISGFVAIASFTAPNIKIAALSSLGVDVITSYYIVLLYPELDRMSRAVAASVLKNEKS